MLIQIGGYVTLNLIANIRQTEGTPSGRVERLSKSGSSLLCNGQFLSGIFLIAFFLHDSFDTVKAFPDFGEGRIQRCEPQADVIGFTKVRDDVHLIDQGAVYAVAVRVTDADMGAALGRIPRGAEGKAKWGKQLVGQGCGVVCHQNGFGADGIHPRLEERVQRRLDREQGNHRLRPGEKTLHARRGDVIQVEIKGSGLAPPAPDGRREFVLNVFIDVEEGGRARPSVEVFIRAADGKVGVAGIEGDGQCADGVTQIPEYERSFAVREFGDASHVIDVAALEGDVGECDECRVIVNVGLQLSQVGGDVVIERGDSYDFMPTLTPGPSPGGRGGQKLDTSLQDI